METLTNPVMIDVIFEPSHYNRNCGCNIPAAYTARVVSGVPEIDDPENEEYLERFGYSKCRIYAMGGNRDEAISLLGHELREFGYTGKMRAL